LAPPEGDRAPGRDPPSAEYLYGEWLRSDYERGIVPGRDAAPDLAPILAMVLKGGRSLLGPPPGAVFDPVPAADLRLSLVAGIPGLLADLDGDEANVLLTFARIWTTIATGEIVAKDVAADWALQQLPPEHQAVVGRARGIYLGTTEDDLAGRRNSVREAIEWIEGQIMARGGNDRAPIPASGPG